MSEATRTPFTAGRKRDFVLLWPIWKEWWPELVEGKTLMYTEFADVIVKHEKLVKERLSEEGKQTLVWATLELVGRLRFSKEVDRREKEKTMGRELSEGLEAATAAAGRNKKGSERKWATWWDTLNETVPVDKVQLISFLTPIIARSKITLCTPASSDPNVILQAQVEDLCLLGSDTNCDHDAKFYKEVKHELDETWPRAKAVSQKAVIDASVNVFLTAVEDDLKELAEAAAATERVKADNKAKQAELNRQMAARKANKKSKASQAEEKARQASEAAE
ncbi:hypothetical protein MNV49_002312 [Pseudohyphozyma bogoriensis]|nr:hypothetical protein MNV49_002312 [Pseudohyphozyma bogoriensis]